jgi:hypothetical protein
MSGKGFTSRQIVALLAAYVVVLQALLLPLSVVASPVFDGGSLCVSAADGKAHPHRDGSGCPCAAACAMPCCVQALAHPPSIAAAFDAAVLDILAPQPVIEATVPSAFRSLQRARAPPAA